MIVALLATHYEFVRGSQYEETSSVTDIQIEKWSHNRPKIVKAVDIACSVAGAKGPKYRGLKKKLDCSSTLSIIKLINNIFQILYFLHHIFQII